MPDRDSCLVVDANIARSAGINPGISYICAEILTAIQKGEHFVKFCPMLDTEWNYEARTFATRWHATMLSKGLLLFDAAPCCPTLSAAIGKIKQPTTRPEAEKDRHLVESANMEGKRILSQDKKARARFAALHLHCAYLESLYWAIVDDGSYGLKAIAWINAGAPLVDDFALVPPNQRAAYS